MRIWIIVGFIAAALTSFSFIPQIIKVKKTRSVKDVSLFMLLQFTCGAIFWLLYGLHLKDTVIISANLVTFLSLLILTLLYFKFRKKNETR